jgi:hypothetical protein
MELQKDNQKDKGISSIPYSPDLFHNDQDFYLAYKKVEHIVAAVFLVTGLIENDQLMKDAIREHSLECLKSIVSLIGKSSLAVTDIQAVASRVLHLSSLLDIAFWSGSVSQMNVTILQREISSTYKGLNDLGSKYKNSFYISSSFFKTDETILSDIKEKEKTIQRELLALVEEGIVKKEGERRWSTYSLAI